MSDRPPNASARARAFAPALILSLGALAGCGVYPFVPKDYEEAELRNLALNGYDEGTRFAEANNLQIALDRFTRASLISPRPRVFYEMGRLQERLGRKEEATISYARALELAPDYQEARFALVQAEFPPPNEAEMLSDPAIYAAWKLDLETKMQAAIADAGLDASDDSVIDEIRRRREQAAEGRVPTASEVRAAIFPAGGEDEELPTASRSEAELNREIILNSYEYHFGNGQRYQKGQEYQKAAEEYRLALAADPSQLEARLNLGDCMLRLERHPQAEFHYLAAIEQFPDSPRPLFKMGNYHETLANPQLAREYYHQSLQRDPDYIESLNNLAALEIRDRNYPGAISLLERVAAIDPDYALAQLNLGVARENSGDTPGALAAYRRYVQLGGEQADQVRLWIQELE